MGLANVPALIPFQPQLIMPVPLVMFGIYMIYAPFTARPVPQNRIGEKPQNPLVLFSVTELDHLVGSVTFLASKGSLIGTFVRSVTN